MKLRTVVTVGTLSILFSVASAFNVWLRWGADIGVVNATGEFGSESLGIYSIPAAGGSGVKHPGLFKFAYQASYDPFSKLVYAFDVNGTRDIAVWNASTWVSSNFTNPDFAPAPMTIYSKGANYIFDLSLGLISYLAPVNGSLFTLATDFYYLYVHKLDPSGAVTLVNQYTRDAWVDAWAVTQDFKYLIMEQTDFYCPNGICYTPKIIVLAIQADYSFVEVKVVETQCSNTSYITVLRISPDNQYLVAGYIRDAIEIFDVSNISNPVSLSYHKASGTGYPMIPTYSCLFAGGPTGQGYADGLTLVGWQNQFNDTYQEVTVMTVPDPVQLASFPTGEPFYACAITPNAHVLTSAPHSISFYKTSQPDSPFAIHKPGCPAMYWLGTIGQHENFYHPNNAECNCPNRAQKPCPSGVQLLGEYEVSPYLVNFSSGFYTAGLDFQVGGNSPSTADWPNVTYPLEFSNLSNDTNWGSGVVLCYAEGVRNLSSADPLVFGKVIMAGPEFPVNCQAYTLVDAVLGAGATGFIRILPEGLPAQGYASSPISFPYLAVTYEMGLSLKLAWNASVPSIFSPGPTPVSGGAVDTVCAWAVVLLMIFLKLLCQ